jgi:hypothetical protein
VSGNYSFCVDFRFAEMAGVGGMNFGSCGAKIRFLKTQGKKSAGKKTPKTAIYAATPDFTSHRLLITVHGYIFKDCPILLGCSSVG